MSKAPRSEAAPVIVRLRIAPRSSADDTIPSTACAPKGVRLADLRLRAGERFSYVYNHSASWEHELRVEAIGPGRSGRAYPRCIAGQHLCPPEWCAEAKTYDETKAELLGLSYSEDLQLMAEFGRAVLAARNGTVRTRSTRSTSINSSTRFAGTSAVKS